MRGGWGTYGDADVGVGLQGWLLGRLREDPPCERAWYTDTHNGTHTHTRILGISQQTHPVRVFVVAYLVGEAELVLQLVGAELELVITPALWVE